MEPSWRQLLREPWIAVLVGTVGLGAAVAASWLLFGGTAAFRGPIPALRDAWLPIYASQAAMVAAGTVAYHRLAGPIQPSRLVKVVTAAWVGEWAVLFVGGTLFANELTPDVASFYWLIGTGGPIQPLAAIAGGFLGRDRRRP